MYVIDQNDNLYSADSDSVATLKTSDNIIMQYFEESAENGIFSFENITILMKPGSKASLTLSVSGTTTYGNGIDFLKNPP